MALYAETKCLEKTVNFTDYVKLYETADIMSHKQCINS